VCRTGVCQILVFCYRQQRIQTACIVCENINQTCMKFSGSKIIDMVDKGGMFPSMKHITTNVQG
jgi:hypothetical protein